MRTVTTDPTAPAFARAGTATTPGEVGLTKREYFATATLAALLSNTKLTDKRTEPEVDIEAAIEYADLLVTALNLKDWTTTAEDTTGRTTDRATQWAEKTTTV